MPTAVLRAIVSADTTAASTKLAALGKQIKTVGSSGGKQLSTFGTVARLGFAAAGVAAAGFAISAVKSASAAGEALNKTRVIFGTSSKAVEEFAASAVKIGIAKAQALDAAAGFGAMFQSAKIATKSSADMSVKIVKLAADMASFNNQNPADMLEDLRSGLAGQVRPLRQFGVFISDARIKAEAYRSGIAKVGTELTDAQKVQARFNVIFQDTAKQQGDFARTVGVSLPNQIRVAAAAFENLKESVGEALLPVATTALKAMVGLIGVFKLVPGPMKTIIVVGVALGGMLVGLGLTIRVVRGALAELGIGLGRTAAAEGTATATTTGLTGALGGLRAGLLTAATAGLGLAGAIALIGLGTSEAIGGQKRHAEHIRAVSVEEQKLTAALNAGKISLRDVTSAAGGNQAALKKVAAAAGIAVDVTERFTPDTWHLREALAAVGRTAPKTPNAIAATGDAAAAAAPHIRSAADVLDYYRRIAASIKTVRFLTGIRGDIRRGHRAQHGGFHRGLTLVGEEGPELVNFGQPGAHVYTNTQTRAMETAIPSGAASAGSSISGDIILQVDGREFARIARDQLLKLKPSRVNLGLA